ncbi:MAG: hypothetical protein AAFQ98_25485, partial [Bacteroidota bacterium]
RLCPQAQGGLTLGECLPAEGKYCYQGQSALSLRAQANYLQTTDNVAALSNPYHLGGMLALDWALPLVDSTWYFRTGLEAGIDLFNPYGLNETTDPVGSTYADYLYNQWVVPWLRLTLPAEIVWQQGKWSPSAGVALGVRSSLGRTANGPTVVGVEDTDLLNFQREFYAMGRVGLGYQIAPAWQVLINYSIPLHQQDQYSVTHTSATNPSLTEEVSINRYLHQVGLGVRYRLKR